MSMWILGCNGDLYSISVWMFGFVYTVCMNISLLSLMVVWISGFCVQSVCMLELCVMAWARNNKKQCVFMIPQFDEHQCPWWSQIHKSDVCTIVAASSLLSNLSPVSLPNA